MPQQRWEQAGIAAGGPSLKLAWLCLSKGVIPSPGQCSSPRPERQPVSRDVILSPGHPLPSRQPGVLGAQLAGVWVLE